MTDTSTPLHIKKGRLAARQTILTRIRSLFLSQGFLEVETPLRILAPAPEIHIDPEPSGDHFLIASPELQMKRLLCAGYDRIFQICRCFRRGERGDRHLPEFTMLEWYRQDGTLTDLMVDCRTILTESARSLSLFPDVPYQGTHLHLDTEWPRIEVQDAFVRFAGWRPGSHPDPLRFDMDMVNRVEPALPSDCPCFLFGYPAAMASLARMDPDNPERALRMEFYAGGLELANGFEELTDAELQRRRFEAEEEQRRAAGKPPFPLDEAFLSDMAAGMPAATGMAMGLDRLIMLLTDTACIDDVVAFTET